MAEPVGCGNGCFNEAWSNCVYLSQELRNFATSKGITTNDCLETLLWGVLEALPNFQGLTALQGQIAALDASLLLSGVNAAGLGGASVEAVAISQRVFTFTAADDVVTYDFTTFRNNLPATSFLRQVRVTSVTDTGKTASIIGAVAQVPLQNLRGTVQFEALVETASGLLEFNKTVVLNGAATGSPILQVNDRTVSPSNLSIAQALQLAISEIVLLKQRVESLSV